MATTVPNIKMIADQAWCFPLVNHSVSIMHPFYEDQYKTRNWPFPSWYLYNIGSFIVQWRIPLQAFCVILSRFSYMTNAKSECRLLSLYTTAAILPKNKYTVPSITIDCFSIILWLVFIHVILQAYFDLLIFF